MQICTSAQYSSTPIASISFKPLDHAVSLSMCVLLGLSAWLQWSLFHHSSAYSSVLCFCGWDGVDKTQCFGYCWAAIAPCQGFLCTPWRWARGWEGTQPAHLAATDQRTHFLHFHDLVLSKESWEKWREGGATGCHLGFPSMCTQYVLRFCFPGNGWTSAYWWNVVKKCIILLCFCV